MLAELIRLSALVGIVGLMFAEGLHVRPGELRIVLKQPALAARSVLAVLFLVPVAAYVCALVFRPPPSVQVGLAILAAAPLCPFVFLKIGRAEGSRVFARSLHVLLAVLAVVTTPLVLGGLGRALALPLRFPVSRTGGQVLLTVLVPMLAGVAANRFAPAASSKVRGPLEKLALALIAAAFAVVLILRAEVFVGLGLRGYLAMTGMVVLSLAIGHSLGGRDGAVKTTLALESSARNPGLALAIATLNFPGAQPAAVLLPYLAVFFVVSGIYGAFRRRAGAAGVVRAGRAGRSVR